MSPSPLYCTGRVPPACRHHGMTSAQTKKGSGAVLGAPWRRGPSPETTPERKGWGLQSRPSRAGPGGRPSARCESARGRPEAAASPAARCTRSASPSLIRDERRVGSAPPTTTPFPSPALFLFTFYLRNPPLALRVCFYLFKQPPALPRMAVLAAQRRRNFI